MPTLGQQYLLSKDVNRTTATLNIRESATHLTRATSRANGMLSIILCL